MSVGVFHRVCCIRTSRFTAMEPTTRSVPADGAASSESASGGNGEERTHTTPSEPTPRVGFPFEPGRDGRQPARVQELVHAGSYLSRPLLFMNRYLIGAVLINIVTFSGVLCVVTVAAYLFRMLDQVKAIDWLYALGFPGDIQRGLFPSTLFLVMWLLTWAISYWRRGAQAPGRVAGWFLTLTVVSVLLAMAALLGTGDISLDYIKDTYGVEPPHGTVHWMSGELQRALPVVLLTALLPYLRIRDLIRSGTKPKNAVEGWIFAIASRALVFGLPLLLFALVARENISSFNEKRMKKPLGVEISTQYEFQPLEFKDWRTTWNLIELQAADYDPDVKKKSTPFEISGRIWKAANRNDDVHQSLEALGKSIDLDTSLSFPQALAALHRAPPDRTRE